MVVVLIREKGGLYEVVGESQHKASLGAPEQEHPNVLPGRAHRRMEAPGLVSEKDNIRYEGKSTLYHHAPPIITP